MKVEKRDHVLAPLESLYQRGTIEAAFGIASFLHQGVKDKGGTHYLAHPVWVSTQLAARGESVEVQITALLHDTIEDTALTVGELAEWFSPSICSAVQALTFTDGMTRTEYTRGVAKNPIARLVKIMDLTHNMDVKRLKNRHCLSAKDLERIRIYAEEYDFLVGGAIGI